MPGGFNGLVDFVGYRVGMPNAPLGGFRGIVDWTGIPCGMAAAASTPAAAEPSFGGGNGAWRKRRNEFDDEECMVAFLI